MAGDDGEQGSSRERVPVLAVGLATVPAQRDGAQNKGIVTIDTRHAVIHSNLDEFLLLAPFACRRKSLAYTELSHSIVSVFCAALCSLLCLPWLGGSV